jgi:hypothetical protein
MRFPQLLILIVLCSLALLVRAQTGPNYNATRTAIAVMTSGTNVVPTRNFLTPASYLLTVTAQAEDATGTARALVTQVPTFEAQNLSDEFFDMTSTALAGGETVVSASGEGSTLLVALLFFGGMLLILAIIGVLYYTMGQAEKRR